MSRFRTSGIPLRSPTMSARRFVAAVPVAGRAAPSHWRLSPAELRAELDAIADECDRPDAWTDAPAKVWRKLARLCLSESPDHLAAWRVLGYSCFKLERYEEAASAYRLLACTFKSAEMYTALGQASRDDAERIEAFQKAIATDESDPEARMNLGYEFTHQERYGEAVETFEHARTLAKAGSSTQDIALFYIGMNALSAGDDKKAMANLIEAVERDRIGAFGEFFDVQIADTCVGHEAFALEFYKHARKVSAEAADRFLSMFARRQKAFELHVKPWEVGSEVLSETIATYGRATV
jgi:tetratricopeptide (TPR) repeat protein